jgi:hypothetical protein
MPAPPSCRDERSFQFDSPLPDAHQPHLAGSHGKQAPAPLAGDNASAEEEHQYTRRIAASLTFQKG